MGPLGRAAGRWELFSEAQGEALTPWGYRFHLPVGQPLASDCRSITDWDPYLGLMRLGHCDSAGCAVTRAAHGQASGQASLGPGFVQEIEDEQALGKLQFEVDKSFGACWHGGG